MQTGRILVPAIALCLTCCRGEPVPRDYQNNPPAMTHPVKSSAQSPTGQGMAGATPEPSSGAEGTSAPNKPIDPLRTTTTRKDQSPTTPSATSTHATSSVTGTRLATPPR